MSTAEKEILVEVKGVSKKFTRDLRRSLVYGLKDIFGVLFGRKVNRSALRKDEFWAVKDVSFTVRRGECVGLIGRNGAGKSTLLKVLNGLMTPDEGSIVMRGKVGALIELGAGFNPLLTGRENIYINGQLLGFTKKEIDQRMPAIMEFAEINEFLDSPVQNYSSGMKVRLGFSIAAQMEPDVLIIDEVLAVGDLGFVLKCFSRIDSLMKNTAVIFVSHSMPQVSRICTDVIMLERGQTVFNGKDVSAGIDAYYSRFANPANNNTIFGSDKAALVSIEPVESNTKDGINIINRLDDLHYDITVAVNEEVGPPFMSVSIYDKEQREVGVCLAHEPLADDKIVSRSDGKKIYRSRLKIGRIALSKGMYSISVVVLEGFRSKPLLRVQAAAAFQVISKVDIWAPIEFEGSWN